MHAYIIRHVLTQELDALECDQHGIEGTSALLRCQCSVCALAVEGYVEALLRKALHVRTGIRTTMHHEGDVQLLKAATLQHLHLAAEALLGRCTIDDELERLRTVHVLQCHRSTETARSLHMMAAAMTEVPKGIVLAEDAELRTALTMLIGRTESRLESADAHLDLETVCTKIVGQQSAGEHLFSLIFRTIKNLIRHRAERIPLCVDRSK